MTGVERAKSYEVEQVNWADKQGLDKIKRFADEAINPCLIQEPDWIKSIPGKKNHSYHAFTVYRDRVLCATALVRFIKIVPGRYLASIRRGPILQSAHDLTAVLKALSEKLRKMGAVSVTFNPRLEDEMAASAVKACEEMGAEILPLSDQPLHTATGLISLDGDADALSARFKQRGRRQIKAAIKAGLEVRVAESLQEAESLSAIQTQFYEGRKLSMENIPTLTKQWEMTRDRGGILLGYLDGQLICGHCFVADGDRAFWLTMVGDDGDKKLPRNYLLLSHALQLAQEQGFKTYDVAGMPSERFSTDDTGAQNRNQFKTAFDPQVVELFPMMKLTLRKTEDQLVSAIKKRRKS